MSTRPYKSRSLRFNLGLWYFIAMAAIAVVVTGYYHVNFSRLSRTETSQRFLALGNHIAAASVLGALAHSSDLLGGVLDGALGDPDVIRVGVFDPGGALIAARTRKGRPSPTWPAPDERACGPCTLESGDLRWVAAIVRTGVSTVQLPDIEERAFYDGPPPAQNSTGPVGYVVLDVSTRRRDESERHLALRAVAIVTTALIAGLVVILFIARRLTSPLRSLANATREIGKGNWNTRLPLRSYGEIEQLAGDFQHMVNELAKLDQENRRHNDTLSDRVAERTRELQDANNDLKQMSDAKDEFVATVSHDFRSPLAIIQTALQTIKNDTEMPVSVRERFLDRAERQCKRLGSLVNDLLDLARIAERAPTTTRVRVGDLISEVMDLARPAFEEKNVSLEAIPSQTPTFVDGDEHYLSRAISNLLDNALKFTPENGKVSVAVEREDPMVTIRVTDTGMGIPAEEQARVFERFFQGERAQGSGRGSGLGLAIVSSVARQHGGRVNLRSEDGQGACFELILPLASESISVAKPTPQTTSD
jgi:signal transduction histidine kinase